MTRLPIPGQDAGQWGDLLNTFLEQSHAADGTLKAGSVGPMQLNDSSISEAKLDTAVQMKLNSTSAMSDATSSSKGVLQLAGDLTGTAAMPVIAPGAITNTKISASAAITKSQLATAVQTSLDKADTALQSVPAAPVSSVAGKTGAVTLVEADITNLTADLATKVPLTATYTTDPGVPRLKVINNYTIGVSTSNQTEIWTGPTLTSWTNEWGGYRCRIPDSENWDAGLRIIAATTQTGKLLQVQNSARTVDLASVDKDGTISSAAAVTAPNIGLPIKAVQATAPDTTGWQTNWFWYDTSTEV